MENILLLRIEIFIFILSFTYFLYFIISRIINTVNFVKKTVKTRTYTDEELEKSKVKIITEDNPHVSNYSKADLNSDNKLKISELLKKTKLNISKWEYELAKNYIIEWLVIDKFDKFLNLELAEIYIIENNTHKAEYIYKDLLLVHNNDFNILKKLAYVLSLQEKYEMATEMYKKAYELDNKDFDILNMLWHLTFYKESYEEAIFYLKKYIKENSRDIDVLMLLWQSYYKLNLLSDSLDIYNRILDIEPYNDKIIKKKNEIINDIELLSNNS